MFKLSRAYILDFAIIILWLAQLYIDCLVLSRVYLVTELIDLAKMDVGKRQTR